MFTKQKQGYPLYVKGNLKLFDHLKLSLSTTISLPRQVTTSVPFIPKNKQLTPLVDPIFYLQIIDQPLRQQITKQKYQLKSQNFYIYFPTSITKLDQKQYKIHLKNYQNLLDAIPRNIRPNVQKFIIWEQGKNQHSIQNQKIKINQALSQLAKIQIQNKLSAITTEIKCHQSQQPPTSKILYYIFILKNKLVCLYSYLQLTDFANDLLSDLWNQIMINFRCLMKLPPTPIIQKLEQPNDIPQMPYIFENTNDILGEFQNCNSTAYLRIVTHAFFNSYTFSLSLGHITEAIVRLKLFLDYTLNNVLVLTKKQEWNQQQTIMFDIARNLWVIEIVIKGLYQYQNTKNTNKAINYNDTNNHTTLFAISNHISICQMLRNSVQRIGLRLYSFNSFSIFPSSIEQELEFISQKIGYIKSNWNKIVPPTELSTEQQIKQKKIQQITIDNYPKKPNIPYLPSSPLKLSQLISKNLTPTSQTLMLLTNRQSYNKMYLDTLLVMYRSLKNSMYSRVARTLHITFERAIIMLGNWEQFEEFRHSFQEYQNKWMDISAIQLLYSLFRTLASHLHDNNKHTRLCQLIVNILQSDTLMKNQQPTLNLIKQIHQVIAHTKTNCIIGQISQIMLSENNSLVLQIKNTNLLHFLSTVNTLSVSTTQTILAQGQKHYQLINLSITSNHKCKTCPTSPCNHKCTQFNQPHLQLTATINLQNPQQIIFYIKQFIIQIIINNYQIIFYLPVHKNISNKLYHINTPKFGMLNQEEDIVFGEIWTPIVFYLEDIVEGTVICQIVPTLKSEFIQDGQLQCNQPRKNKEKQLNSDEEYQIEIAQSVFIYEKSDNEQKDIESGSQKKNYYKTSQKIDYLIPKHQPSRKSKLQITIFAKYKQQMSKIRRSSMQKIQQLPTNEYIYIQLTLQTVTTKKYYTLNYQTNPFIVRPLFEISYNSVQTCQQFILSNINKISLQVTTTSPSTTTQHHLPPTIFLTNEQISLLSRFITLAPLYYPHMKFQLNFNNWFDNDYLLQNQSNTFKIWYQFQYQYTCFEPIQILSQSIGKIAIPTLEQSDSQGFEIIGKINGEVQYTNKVSDGEGKDKDKGSKDNYGINLWLIPIRTGNIILPEIWIGGKKGIWKNSIITNIQLK